MDFIERKNGRRPEVSASVIINYSSPCILRPPIQSEKMYFKMEEHTFMYTENIKVWSLMGSLKIQGSQNHRNHRIYTTVESAY